jgi:DNA ligase-1
MIHDRIYKRDSQGRLRVWFIEQDGSRYRVHSGLEKMDATVAVTGWTQARAASQPTDQAQADFEIASAYENKLTREYHRTIEATDSGAHFFKPMLAKEFTGWDPKWHEVVVQPKLDGIRCIATEAGLFSRQGKPITAVPHIHAQLMPLFQAYPGLVLDGELYNHEYKENFNAIVSIVRKQNPTADELELAEAKIQYHVYDVPSNNARCTKTRLEMLGCAVRDHGIEGAIVLVPTERAHHRDLIDSLYGIWLEQGYEGQMVRLPGTYEQKRSKLLLKRKEFQDAEYEVISIEEGEGNWAGVAKAVRCRLPDGRVFGAGIRGSRERAAELLHEAHKVATVRFFALTPDGVPRFPVVTKFHGAERTL